MNEENTNNVVENTQNELQAVQETVTSPNVPTESVQMNEEKPKKKSKLPLLLVIILLLIIAGCLVYYFFLKDKIGNNTTTTTTVAALTEDEAKKIALVTIKDYYSNGYLTDNAACFASIIGNISDEELVQDETDTSFSDDDQCNGYFSRLKNYKSIDELKNYLHTKLTSTFTDKVLKKYRSNEKGVYCCLMATETSTISKDSFEITTIAFEENEITFEYKYVKVFEEGGSDENDTPITFKTSTDVFEKGVIKKDNNTWKIDNVTFVRNGETKEEKVYD